MVRMAIASLVVLGFLMYSQPVPAQPSVPPIVGVLTTASAVSRDGEQLAAFRDGLKEAGYSEGKNVKIEYRWANNDYSQLPVMAAELARLGVAVIVAAGGHVSALAARDATKEIPIVFTTVTDPVKAGLVKSFNHPGGMATGTAGLTAELDPKRLELLLEMKPKAKLIGVLVNPDRPTLDTQLREITASADKANVKLDIQRAASVEEIDKAFQAFVSHGVNALVVAADPLFNNNRARVVLLASVNSLPAIYQWREFVTAGGLMSYGPSIADAYRQAGIYAGKIVSGAKPANIPVVQPTKYYLTINNKVVRELGLTVPPALFAIADDLID